MYRRRNITQLSQPSIIGLHLLDLAIDTVGEEASRCASSAEVDNLQNLSRCPGVGNCVAILGHQHVVAEHGVVDALIIIGLCAIKHVPASRDGIDNGGDVDAVGGHDITVLNEGGAYISSVVGLNCQDTCRPRRELLDTALTVHG